MTAPTALTAVPAAVDDAGVLHRAREIGTGDLFTGVLHCGGCRALVDAVRPHTWAGDGAVVEVRGHFRLAPGHSHEIACPFDFPRAAARIARAAPGIVRSTPTGYAVTIPDAPARAFGAPARSWRPGRIGSTTAFMAGETVATVGRIAQLLRRFGGQHVAPGAFTAAWHRQSIDWPDFCFDAASCVELVGRLHVGDSPWPLAVLFNVERAGQSKAGTSWWAGEITDQHANIDGQRVAVRITVRARTPHAIGALTLGGDALAFGDWRLYRPPTEQAPHRTAVVEAVLWIGEAWQMARVSGDLPTHGLKRLRQSS